MVILGVDPGLSATGYGVTQVQGDALRVVTAGDIRPARKQPLAARLGVLHEELSRLIEHHRPDTVVLEMIFTHRRFPSTSPLLGHARGVACLAAEEHGVPVAEYPPARVKMALTGGGGASKERVAQMVEVWIGRREASWSADATDALALTIAHARLEAQRRRLAAGVAG